MKGRIRLFWLILAVVCSALAVFACLYAGLFGSIINRPEGNPADTVTQFFESIRYGNYPLAYSCLSDYSTLGLEQEPETPEAKAVYDALKKSYTWSLDGDCAVNGTEATQKLRLRALNIRRTEAAVASRVDPVLQEMLAEKPNSEIYDETGGYRSSLTDAVYTEALNRALADADSLCETTNLEIRLQYIDGSWKIITDRALMNALVGGQS